MSDNIRPETMARITTPELAEAFIAEQLTALRAQIGDKKVLLALSGGVDSSVVAALLIKAVGKQLVCVHVNHGLLRKGEPEQVIEVFRNQMDANLIYVDAVDRFLDKLAGVDDPETKRKIIGKEFIDVFAEEAKKLDGIEFLAQGTIYPDILESHGVKAHHNVGGLPEDLNFELVEPVKFLYKDEVRVVGKALGLPDNMVYRQPFPGPGLGVRIIGERINPTGKPLFKEALKNRDFEYILREGVNEEKNGADILDVNVGLPGIDEAETLEKAVTTLQAVTELPLQIDTSDASSLERALRVYNGKALVNSVNGTEKSMNTVFPLVKKYGGAVVCLAMDENGIPETAEKRLDVIRRIVSRAEEYGIKKSDLVADALVTTQAVSPDAASVTLETVRLIKEKLGIPTVLGVSNISFGLPNRERINAAFFGMALDSGLSGGIVNPSSELLMFVYNTYINKGYEKQFGLYTTLSAEEKKNAVKGKNDSLKSAVISGLSSVSAEITTRLLAEKEPLDIINGELIPALDEIGRGFENGKIYLPQLLNASDAAKASFDVIKSAYKTEKTGENKIILATVKGDIHDIGKNIVKVLLENYGFDVIDLGKNVPPEDVLKSVTENDVKLVGLSALMTTTVVSMAETIKLLHEKAPDVRVMVGGAVLNAEYASSIGADFYGKDAVASVKYAREFFGV